LDAMDGSVKGIANLVQKEPADMDKEFEEVDDSDSKDEVSNTIPSCADLIALCQRLEQGCKHVHCALFCHVFGGRSRKSHSMSQMCDTPSRAYGS
jgi:hypothetical protein